MKTKIHSQSGIFNPRILAAFALGSVGILLAMLSFAANPPRGMKDPSASSAGASAFVDNHAVPLKGNAAAPASSMPLAPTGPAWSIVTSPNTSTTQQNFLSGVTCASASDCWAVGQYNTGGVGGVDQTLIERWNGTAWSIVTSPNTSTTEDNFLFDVTCASASDCWAVGYATGSLFQTLIEHWNGTAWSIVPSPNHTSTRPYDFLYGVTCTSASDCWAVGSYIIESPGSPSHTLIEHWNGTAWSIVTSPDTGGLSGITCASASDCWAVGDYRDRSRTLTVHWNGTAWSIVTSPNTSAGTWFNSLSGVTCASASNCWAVGRYYTGSIFNHPVPHTLIEHWNGTAWSIVTSPTTSAGLSDVTCASASDCWAVGDFIEHWNGTAWSIVTSPDTGGLSGITCTSASDCWAVGYYGDNVSHTLIERYTPSVPAQLGNISTRAFLQTGDDVMIGGFIIEGSGPKTVIVRAIGPELIPFGIPNALADPTLELHDGTRALIASNNNWQTTIIGGIITSDQVGAIQNSGHAPLQPSESAIIATLPPGNYTAIVGGVNNTVGVALVEVYDLSTGTTSILGNISTRDFVQTGDDVMIGGFIVQGSGPKTVIVRGIGPELTPFGIPNALADPTLELHDGTRALIASNNNWQTTIIGGIITSDQVGAIQNSGHAPTQPSESAIIATLPPGNYTAIVRGVNNTVGVALVEVYDLPPF